MRELNLKTQTQLALLATILVTGILMTTMGYYVIQHDIISRAQKEVTNAISAAQSVYQGQIDNIRTGLSIVVEKKNLGNLKKILGIDYVFEIPVEESARVASEIARAAFGGQPSGGTRIIGEEELAQISPQLPERIKIAVISTPKARPTKKKELTSALAIEYAVPMFDDRGNVTAIRYAGKIINQDFTLVDRVRDLVFNQELYEGKPQGTVTIFQDDVRIATNVLDNKGERAVGTRVSDIVYRKVVGQGEKWLDRAFVVTDWYLTAYQPIRGINGNIIGILYVGLLEKPFIHMKRNLFVMLFSVILFASIVAMALSYKLSDSLSAPLTIILQGIRKISGGDLNSSIQVKTTVKELNEVEDSFNEMAQKLVARERSLAVTNEKLSSLNKSYLDMIGFVSHELKGVLGSIVMNIFSVKEGYLGELNEKQARAIDAAAKSLSHFENMVRNYLDLSRIEKGELQVAKTEVNLDEEILKPAIEHFEKERLGKGMTIENNVSPEIKISADRNLLTIVCNNLLGNAIKYGSRGGRIVVSSQVSDDFVLMRFYNDGHPIPEDQKGNLFKRFSRLPSRERVKGTGLGLFIVKEIIEKHGGKIWLEVKEKGNEFVFQLSRE
ncbi:MAG: cache domain-containing protein [Candidatus Omnitrophota bacterium]